MTDGTIEERALEAARGVAAERGVVCEDAEVLSAGSNVLVHLRPSPVVARVMTGTVVLHDDPERWLRREVEVTEFLAPAGLAVAPSPLIAPGPVERDGLWMTFVEYVEGGGHREQLGSGDDAERFGLALRELHEALAPYDGDLAGFADLGCDIERSARRCGRRPS